VCVWGGEQKTKADLMNDLEKFNKLITNLHVRHPPAPVGIGA
jgi:hypothetical protein